MLKRLFVLCDGTGNSPQAHLQKVDGENVTVDAGATNVERLRNILIGNISNINQKAKEGWEIHGLFDQKAHNMVYYDCGLGAPPFAGRPRRIHNLHSQLNGFGITENVIEAYDFLATNYIPGNTEIYLFGFSRGAYTIRLLAAMLDHIGLVRTDRFTEKPLANGETREIKQYIPQDERELERIIKLGFSLYDKRKTANLNNPVNIFIENYSRNISVNFMGLWDTVRGKVSRNERVLISSKLSRNVVIARHAVSIDERRKIFKPQIWITRPDQNSKQVWFSGAHADVGGGYPERGLSDISLKWMIDELNTSNNLNVPTSSLDPQPLASQFDSLNGPIMEGLPSLKWSNATKKYHRPVLQTDATESIHPSVFVRYSSNTKVEIKVGHKVTQSSDYKPSNLSHIFILYNNLNRSRKEFEDEINETQNVQDLVQDVQIEEQSELKVSLIPQLTAGEIALQQFDESVQKSSTADSWSDVEEDPNLAENRDKLHQIRSLRFMYRASGMFVKNSAVAAHEEGDTQSIKAVIGRPQIS